MACQVVLFIILFTFHQHPHGYSTGLEWRKNYYFRKYVSIIISQEANNYLVL